MKLRFEYYKGTRHIPEKNTMLREQQNSGPEEVTAQGGDSAVDIDMPSINRFIFVPSANTY